MQTINSLVNGMHSDNDPNAQPPNTYRDALNGNLITVGQNIYAFESVDGTEHSFTLATHQSGQKLFIPIGFGSFLDKLIVFSADDSTIKAGEIGKVVFDNQGGGTYTPLYYHDDLRFTREHPFPKDGVICRKENNAKERVYFTDYYNPFRVFNAADSRFTTYIASGDLVVGDQYMVLSNGINVNIVHNATTYGCGHTNTNVFTAVNANYTGSAHVIKYVPYEMLDVVPQHNLGNIELKQLAYDGSLYGGSNQYFYQLETSDGARTNFSYVSRPIYIGGTNSPGDTTLSYQNVGGNLDTVDTKKRVILTINGIDTNFDKIRVGVVRATDFKVFEDPEIFYTGVITGASMDISHYGNEVGEALQNADLTTSNSVMDLVKSITTSKNYLFPAHVSLANDINFDMSGGVSCETFKYELPGDLAGEIDATDLISSGNGITGQARCGDLAIGNTSAKPGQWYEVVATAGTVSYNGSPYNNGEFFQGVFNVFTITPSAAPGDDAKAIAVIRIQKYTSSTTLGVGNYKNIRILGDYGDYKGAVVSHYMASHWRSERYRYAMVLWSKQGFPFFARWLCDKSFPSQYATTDPDTAAALSYNPRLIDHDTTTEHTKVNVLGARFSDLDFSLIATALGCALADIDQYLKGFSIVRCERDATIIGQGMLYATVADGSITRPMATNDMGNNVGAWPNRRDNFYNWFSPDFILEFDQRPNMASGDYLQIQDYYDVTNIGTGTAADGLLAVSGYNYYWKHYAQIADPAVGNALYGKGALQYIIPGKTVAVTVAATGVVPSAGGVVFDNVGENNAAVTPANYTGAGGRSMLVALDVDETAYANGFGNHGQYVKPKPIVNWVRSKSAANLYGGTSDDAKANNTYIWAGHYQAFDADFMTYMTGTADATPAVPGQVKVAGIVNNVEVFGGDAFINHYDAIRTIKDNSQANQVAYATVFPCESNVNIAMRREGIRHFANQRFYHITEAPDGVLYDPVISGSQDETYNYEEYYSNIQHQMNYPAAPVNWQTQTKDEAMIPFSDPKVDGQAIDAWRTFRPNNFKRVDGNFGGITNVRAKGSKLFYWQSKGIGYLPVHERTTMGSALGDVVQLGVGGILERFDEIDYHYGNQHQFSLMESDSYFAWFDLRRRAILRMSFGGAMDKVTLMEGVSQHISLALDAVEAEASPNIFDSDNPLTGKGISSVYDSNNALGLMTFKFSETVSGRVYERDFTLGFSRDLDKYIGFFSFACGIYGEHNGFLLASKLLLSTIANSSAYVVGDELADPTNTNFNYVCILAYTSANPAIAPSSDATHWVSASQINQTHVFWRGEVCKFFGVVYPWHISVVIKAPGSEVMSVDNVEVKGNSTAFSDIYNSNSSETGSDLVISTTNRNYKYVDGSWWFNLPFSTRKTRLTDSYEILKMRVKNYVTSPVTSINFVKRIFSVKSSIRKKL